MVSKSDDYKAQQIQVLEGLDPVRKRPAMYIGSTGKGGLHHLVYEVIDNSIDEAMNGHCNNILITLHDDGSCSVKDDGRGIPVDPHKQYKIPAVELVMTKLHAGGKFDNDTYKVSGGLHGVGVSVVNALSEWLEVTIHKDGGEYHQKYKKGVTASKLKKIGTSDISGTVVRFKPDASIFETVVFDKSVLTDRFRELAYLNAGLSITIQSEGGASKTFHYKGGLSQFVSYLNKGKTGITKEPLVIDGEKNDVQVSVALQWTQTYKDNIHSFTNNIATREGGTHLSGFRSALTRTLNNVSKKRNFLKGEQKLEGGDITEGLTAIISTKVPEPQFEGQTKTKLGNSEVKGIVDTIVSKALNEYFDENPTECADIINKCIQSYNVREAAKKAADITRRKGLLESSALPGKLTDCQTKVPSESELFIVEGDSAGGSAKQGRDSFSQAILPLRGKILNVEKARPDKMLANNEIQALITAIGCNIVLSEEDEFKLDDARYHKIIIMTDADVDGAHIRTLLLTFVFRYMYDLIKAGYVYIAQPPLYKISKGKKFEYAYSEEEMVAIQKTMPNSSLQRYKGLGEMNPSQLWQTTMDPETRTLLQVSVDDFDLADKLFTDLMGDDVTPRKEFIEAHAKEVVNIDI